MRNGAQGIDLRAEPLRLREAITILARRLARRLARHGLIKIAKMTSRLDYKKRCFSMMVARHWRALASSTALGVIFPSASKNRAYAGMISLLKTSAILKRPASR